MAADSGGANAHFVTSAHALSQLPEPIYPEVAFAGRSNVGKSSLLNKLLNRRGLVKVSATPGKTQALNYFLVDERYYLVDLPGYGFARVPKEVQNQWQRLIEAYLESRATLKCVVVLFDIRHQLKEKDRELVGWLRNKDIPCLPVYTKADKLSRNEQFKNAALLDAGLVVAADSRIIFSAKSGQGRDNLLSALDHLLR
jgi:GTP-binding protein